MYLLSPGIWGSSSPFTHQGLGCPEWSAESSFCHALCLLRTGGIRVGNRCPRAAGSSSRPCSAEQGIGVSVSQARNLSLLRFFLILPWCRHLIFRTFYKQLNNVLNKTLPYSVENNLRPQRNWLLLRIEALCVVNVSRCLGTLHLRASSVLNSLVSFSCMLIFLKDCKGCKSRCMFLLSYTMWQVCRIKHSSACLAVSYIASATYKTGTFFEAFGITLRFSC